MSDWSAEQNVGNVTTHTITGLGQTTEYDVEVRWTDGFQFGTWTRTQATTLYPPAADFWSTDDLDQWVTEDLAWTVDSDYWPDPPDPEPDPDIVTELDLPDDIWLTTDADDQWVTDDLNQWGTEGDPAKPVTIVPTELWTTADLDQWVTDALEQWGTVSVPTPEPPEPAEPQDIEMQVLVSSKPVRRNIVKRVDRDGQILSYPTPAIDKLTNLEVPDLHEDLFIIHDADADPLLQMEKRVKLDDVFQVFLKELRRKGYITQTEIIDLMPE